MVNPTISGSPPRARPRTRQTPAVPGGRDVRQVSPDVGGYTPQSFPDGVYGEGDVLAQQAAGIQNAAATISKYAEERMAAEARIRARKESINRTRDEVDLNSGTEDIIEAFKTAGDLTNDDDFGQLGADLRDLVNASIAGHNGGPESRDIYAQRAEALLGSRQGQIAKERRDIVSDRLDAKITSGRNQLASGISFGSLSYGDAVSSGLKFLREEADGLSPPQEMEAHRKLIADLGDAEITRLINDDRPDLALAFIESNPGFTQAMDKPDRDRVAARFAAFSGEKTPEQKGADAATEKMAEAAMLLHGAPNPKLLDRETRKTLSGVYKDPAVTRQKTLQIFTSIVPKLKDGTATEAEIVAAIVVANDYGRIQKSIVAGVPTTTQTPLPEPLVQAFAEAGILHRLPDDLTKERAPSSIQQRLDPQGGGQQQPSPQQQPPAQQPSPAQQPAPQQQAPAQPAPQPPAQQPALGQGEQDTLFAEHSDESLARAREEISTEIATNGDQEIGQGVGSLSGALAEVESEMEKRGLAPQQEAQQEAQAEAPQVEAPVETPERRGEAFNAGTSTLFENADLIVGPAAVFANWASNIPWLNIGAPKENQAQSVAKDVFKDLVTSRQNNPKFNEGERVAIVEDLTLKVQSFSNPRAFRNGLVGVVGSLDVRKQSYLTIARDEGISQGKRDESVLKAEFIDVLQKRLLPPIVTSRDDYLAFVQNNPPGTKFVGPSRGGTGGDYSLFQVPYAQ